MREITPAASGGVITILCVLLLIGDVKAEQRSAPWDADACNETCRWWMSLGAKPAADVKPPLPGPSPALSVKAIVPDADLSAAASPALGATVMKSLTSGDKPGRTRSHGRADPVLVLLPPERPAYIPGQSLWGVPIQGSTPIVPALLLSFP